MGSRGRAGIGEAGPGPLVSAFPWEWGAMLRQSSEGTQAHTWPPPGFHLNNQLTQALTSRYRDSRLRVDFERFVSCMAQLLCLFREYHHWPRRDRGPTSPQQGDQGGGRSPHPSLPRPLQPAPGRGRGSHLPDPQTGEPRLGDGGAGVPESPASRLLSSVTQWMEVATFS